MPAPEELDGDWEQPERNGAAVQDAAARHAPEHSTTSAETADLLEALRRRRGQREPAPTVDDEEDPAPAGPAPIATLFDQATDLPEPAEEPAPAPAEPSDTTGRRRRRNAMPSWDEIVFGARTDE